jgi:Cu2+-exporting ATPase
LLAENVSVHAASGLSGKLDNTTWKIGKADFVLGKASPGSDDTIWLSDENDWVARFELQDSLRQDAHETVQRLQGEGMRLAVLSGDSRVAVDRVADRLGIESRAARQTPEMKLAGLEELRQAGRHVLMVGDGVNDAPVLAAADVSMTVKGGAELANSAADMILTSESLGLVNKAIGTARRTRQLVRQNLTWAIMYNTSVMPLAVSGLLKPWMAALGMSLSSLLVVANASRMVRENTEKAKP